MLARSAVALCILGLAALASAPAAHAQGTTPPVLPRVVDGVRVDRGAHGRLTLVFTTAGRKLHKRLAGRTATVDCEQVATTTGPLLTRPQTLSGLTVTVRIPPRRRTVRLSDGTSDQDVCRLKAQKTTRTRRTTTTVQIADLSLPVTQRGAVFLDERVTARTLLDVLGLVGALAAKDPDGTYPTAQDVIAKAPSPAGRRVVALDGPDATPPVGRYGLWTDGAARAVAVATSKSGRRIFVDANGEAFATNAPEPLFAD